MCVYSHATFVKGIQRCDAVGNIFRLVISNQVWEFLAVCCVEEIKRGASGTVLSAQTLQRFQTREAHVGQKNQIFKI